MKLQKSSIISGLQILKSIYAIKVLKRRIPLYCEWEVTNHCNMKCDFCSTWINNRNLAKDISTEEAVSIIEQLSELGTNLIHFSGGEPTLRNDLPELVTKAKEKNIIVSITTNGSASIKTMEKIIHADLILVSIDGTREFHDTIRNMPGAFDKAMETLQFLRYKNRKLMVTTTYTPETPYEMIKELCEICKELNIRIAINVLGKNINNDSCYKDEGTMNNLIMSLLDVYINAMRKLRREYREIVVNPEPLITIIQKGGLDVFGCRAMDITVSLKADGCISLPCNSLSLRRIKGNLKEIFYSKEALGLRTVQGNHVACRGCYIKCMCSASALLKIRGLTAIFSSYINSLCL